VAARSASSASRPSTTASAACPSLVRMVSASVRLTVLLLSSATRVRARRDVGWSAGGLPGGSGLAGGGRQPARGAGGPRCAGWSRHPPRPPERRARAFPRLHADAAVHQLDELLGDREPRPVPPYFRVVDASTCSNGAKRVSSRSAGMPMPVSATEKRTAADEASLRSSSARIATVPRLVNFTPLPPRLTRTCRPPPGSPRRTAGTSVAGSHVTR